MIYYPLAMLMLAGIRDILIISTPYDLPMIEKLMGNGDQWGIRLHYQVQDQPGGIPQAFLIGKNFIADNHVTLVLGDNLFYGNIDFFKDAVNAQELQAGNIRARIFALPVADPQNYGVVEFHKQTFEILSLEEKPNKPKSQYVVPGLYIFDSHVVEKSQSLRPSPRGELEIMDVLKLYWKENALGLTPLTRGMAWLDMGTPKSLLEASTYVKVIEERQGLKIACLEEVALRMGFIDMERFQLNIEQMPKSSYRSYLEGLW